MIHNPNKDFTSKATAFINDWDSYPITSVTTKDVSAQTWKSDVSLPLSLFNVEAPAGTAWRMNFFRTYYETADAEQEYGAWNPNKLISFHQTPCFGRVRFAGAVAEEEGAEAEAAAAARPAAGPHGCDPASLPSLEVPRCGVGRASAAVDRRLGTLAADFPRTTVELCYTDEALELRFLALDETSYLVNNTLVNNDPLWMWTVMEAFIATGRHDPTAYLEFEVAPNNRIWTGLIHNPHKDFTSKATAFIDDWDTYPIVAVTENDVRARMWQSDVSLPLSLFNVAAPAGTVWRMNFFRTYYAHRGAEQEYGAWNPNKLISFHQTPCFGHVRLAEASAAGTPAGDEAAEGKTADRESWTMAEWSKPESESSASRSSAWLSALALGANVCSMYA